MTKRKYYNLLFQYNEIINNSEKKYNYPSINYIRQRLDNVIGNMGNYWLAQLTLANKNCERYIRKGYIKGRYTKLNNLRIKIAYNIPLQEQDYINTYTVTNIIDYFF